MRVLRSPIKPQYEQRKVPDGAGDADDYDYGPTIKPWGFEPSGFSIHFVIGLAAVMFFIGFGVGIGFTMKFADTGFGSSTDLLNQQKFRSLNALLLEVDELVAKQDILQNAIFNVKQRIFEAIDNAVIKYDANKSGLIDCAIETSDGDF